MRHGVSEWRCWALSSVSNDHRGGQMIMFISSQYRGYQPPCWGGSVRLTASNGTSSSEHTCPHCVPCLPPTGQVIDDNPQCCRFDSRGNTWRVDPSSAAPR
ncbi:unnamed protein product [Pleuronectes platessa]|uniref:Uncharacterized protein n=1 Tax=Pleuronectes platessa TaxID=8262 RepID=A0A9N7USA5_PLEPL|nr:unnamed protein product [Pleuronectes platessa]